MSAGLLDRTETRQNPVVTDDDFTLDLRVVESTTPLVIEMCSTGDGCGNTCQTSACNSSSNDPA